MPKSSSRASSKLRKSSGSRRGIAPEDLLRLVFVADPQLAPDGRSILFLRKQIGEKNEYVTNLWRVPTDGGPPQPFTSGGKDSHGRWSPDGARVALISTRQDAPPQIYTLPATGGEATPLTRFPEGTIGTFRWSPDGQQLAVSFRETEPEFTREAKKRREETGASLPPRVIDELYYREDGDGYFGRQRYRLYVVDAASGEHRLIWDRDTLGRLDFDWSPDGTELIVSGNVQSEPLTKWWRDDLHRINVRTGKAHRLALPEGHKSAVRWSPNGQWIAFAGREGKEIWGVRNTRLSVCDPEGRDVRDLTGHTDYCLSATTLSDTAPVVFGANFQWTADSRRIVFQLGWQGTAQIASIAADGGEVVLHTAGRHTLTLGNVSRDGRRAASVVSTPTEPAEIALCDLASVSPSRLTAFNKPLLDEISLAPVEEHWVESTDGARVHLWMMVPPDFEAKRKHPAVLEIHGGPHTQYGETFFHEFQVLAAAGYVVVYGNPRGSKGYGEAHCAAIRGQWGAADWEDVQAVTAWMKRHPRIDARRLGVMGGSYGGYMTNWAIGHTHDFAAAITDRCVSNLVSMAGSSDLPLVPGEYWDASPWDRPEPLWEQSPLRHFGNVRTPTLVIHSEGDLRCNVEQAEQVFAALKLRGVPTRFVRYPQTTSHGLSRGGPPDLRVHRLRQILEWWKTYLR